MARSGFEDLRRWIPRIPNIFSRRTGQISWPGTGVAKPRNRLLVAWFDL